MQTVVVHEAQLTGTESAKSRLSTLVQRHPLASFFALAYVISWALWIPFVLSEDSSPTGFAFVLVLLGSLVPSAVAIALVAVLHGRAGVRKLLRRLLVWRVGVGWWVAVVLLSTLAVVAVGLSILLGGDSPDVAVAIPAVVVMFVFFVFPGSAGGEEIGWRGFALPHLQSARSALRASVVLGVVWGVWHLPLYMVESDIRPLSLFAPWVLLTVASSVIYTWMYNGTGGSLLIVVLFHAASNLPLTILLEPLDDQVALPFLIYVALMVVAASVVVAVTGPATLSRTRAKQVAIDPGGDDPDGAAALGAEARTAPGAITAPAEQPAVAQTVAAGPAPRSRGGAGRVVLFVVGVITALLSLALLAGGTTLVVVDQTQRDDDRFLMSPSEGFSTATYAIVSDSVDVDFGGSESAARIVLGDVRIRSESNREVFVGIARDTDVEEYLNGVERSVVTDIGRRPEYSPRRGGAPSSSPASRDFWVASASGSGDQTLEWEPEDGSWSAVVMNSDGSRGVASELSIGAELDAALLAGIVLLGVGALLAALAAIAITAGARRGRAARRGGPPTLSRTGAKQIDVP